MLKYLILAWQVTKFPVGMKNGGVSIYMYIYIYIYIYIYYTYDSNNI
jgi:hypothetical protein